MMSQEGTATLTLEEIAALCGGRTSGGSPIVTRVSSPVRATRGSLVFAEDEESFAAALRSEASAILVSASLVSASPATLHGFPASQERLILVADPRLSFARCAQALAPPRTSSAIHPTANVDLHARLGARASVGAGAVIEAEAVLGDDVTIASRAVIHRGVQVGQRVVVQAGAVLGSLGFGYVRDGAAGEYLLFPQQGELIIEDDVEIGANTTIDRGALGETRIGRGTKIDNLVHIGHNCRIGKNVIIAAQVGISGSSVVEDGAILAGQVGISDHCRIGPGVILGGQAGVYRGKSVEGAGQVFAGTPAEPLKEHMRSLARLRRLK